ACRSGARSDLVFGAANYWYPGQGWQGPALTFFCLGFVTFCPGTWAVRIVYHVWRGTPGYSLTQLPAVGER
ncbi:MAG: transmembrane domain-containing protein, partial [Promethearchaeia archaeon]